jgi:hypothetical protein
VSAFVVSLCVKSSGALGELGDPSVILLCVVLQQRGLEVA